MTSLSLTALLSLLPYTMLSHSPDTCELAERLALTRSRGVSVGDVHQVRELAPGKWPVNVRSIGHTIASYQNYQAAAVRADLPNGPYFHHGLDIRADAGSNVFASRGGKVINIENYVPGDSSYWEIAVQDDDGFVWQYHHVDRNAIPTAIFNALRDGTRIADGTLIGKVVSWPVSSFGERYHHIHLNVLAKGDVFQSPFLFLDPLQDTQSPRIARVGILKNGQVSAATETTGPYSLFLETSDLIQHQKFLVPPNQILLKVDNGSWQLMWDFTELPGGASETKYVHDFYVPSATCGNYTCRKLTIDLGFALPSRRVFPKTVGAHKVAVAVVDDAGNRADANFSWRVR